MSLLTIKTNNGFDTTAALIRKPPTANLQSATWQGTGLTYDSNGNITGGIATKVDLYDALGSIQATVKLSTPWDFAKQGVPQTTADLLVGDSTIIGGAGDDVLRGGSGVAVDGAYSYNGHSYLLSNAATWTDAEAQAVSRGGHLVTINDQAENDWLVNTFGTQGFWIGLTDQETEGVYRWSNGESFSYANWNGGQPDNAWTGENNGLGEDYVQLVNGYSGHWNDLPAYWRGTTFRFSGIIELNTATSNTLFKGGNGNDTYTIDSAGDKILESKDQGTDSVNSSITYKLPANVENLTLTGTDTLRGFANNLNNTITGNGVANVLLGFAGNDTLSGGLGNDTLNGGDNTDTALYSGVSSDYQIDYTNKSLTITDTNTSDGDEGVDVLSNIEKLQFADTTVDTALLNMITAATLFKDKDVGGYYSFLSAFSGAAYYQKGDKYQDDVFGNSPFEIKAYKSIQAIKGFNMLSAKDIGLFSGISADGVAYEFSNARAGHGVDGRYQGDNAYAITGRTSDALFLAFRGNSDWRDYADMLNPLSDQYSKYQPLLDALDNYLIQHPEIKNVYVTGHGFGGAMTEKYIQEHGDNSVAYHGVTFGGVPSQLMPPANGIDPRLIEFEINGDLIADFGVNAGYVVAVDSGVIQPSAADFGKLLSLILQQSHRDVVYHKLAQFIDDEGIRFEKQAVQTQGKDPAFSGALISTAVDSFGTVNIAEGDDKLSFTTAWDALQKIISSGVDAFVSWVISVISPVDIAWGTVDLASNGWELVQMAKSIINQGTTDYPYLLGGDGKDELAGGGYNDYVSGGRDDDNIGGGRGNDVLYGGMGNDIIDKPMNGFWSAAWQEVSGGDFWAKWGTTEVAGKIESSISKEISSWGMEFTKTGLSLVKSVLLGGLGSGLSDVMQWQASGNDTMYGGSGNDTYFVNSNADVINENSGDGDFDAVVIAGNRALAEFFNSKDYVLPENVEILIAKDDIVFNPSENFAMSVNVNDSNKHYLIGNGGNNKIAGGLGADTLIGGADADFLEGNAGNDLLIGNKYDALSLSFDENRLPTEVRDLIDTYADAFTVDNQDVSYLKGGLGQDEMYGSRLDNDYFLVDVNLANITGNVDSVKDFYMANALSDASAEDYLVFSGEQLGIDIFAIDSNPIDYPDVLGSNNATYLSSLNFQVENNINGNIDYGWDAEEPTFILSKTDKGLYFDKDGVNTTYIPTLLTHIEPADYGWSSDLSTFDADQILLVGSFNNLTFA